MDFELYSLLSTVILIATILTVIFAIGSYIAFRVRENRTISARHTQPSAPSQPAASRFFRPYEPTA